MDNTSIWGVDCFWDKICRYCDKKLIVIHTPVVHYDFKNLSSNGAVRRKITDYEDQVTCNLKEEVLFL